MLGLILIYFLGKYFYDLAEQHKRHAWGHAILGVVVYYAGSFIAAFFIGVIMEFSSPGSIDSFNEYALGLMALPFGLLAAWGLYKYLEKRFKNVYTPSDDSSDILDDEFLT